MENTSSVCALCIFVSSLFFLNCDDPPEAGPDSSSDGDADSDADGDSDADTDGDGDVRADAADADPEGDVDADTIAPIPTGPVLVFSDLTHGPATGWSESEPNKGAVVTVWGHNLGTARGTSVVTVSGVSLDSDSHYPEPWGEAGMPVPFLQRVSFWLTSDMPAGAGGISVTVEGETSNVLPFTIREGSIYFVDGNASGHGSGTHADPWSSPSSFVDSMAAGDIGYFREAVYDQQYNGGRQNIWLRSTDTSGTSDAPIAFVGYPGERPVFDSRTNGSASFHTSFNFDNTFITLSRMTIDAWAVGVSVDDDSRVVGNDITGGINSLSGYGVIGLSANGSVALGNAIHGGRTEDRLDHAIYISGCAPRAGNELAWNYIYDNRFDRGPLIVVNHEAERCPSDVFVRSHRIHHNFVDCSADGSRAIGIFDLSWDGGSEEEPEPTLVYNNIAHQCGRDSHAAMYQNAAHVRFYNNTISQSRSGGISVGGDRVVSSSIVNNIIHLASGSSTYVRIDSGEVTVSNNLYFGAGTYDGPDPAQINADPLMIVDTGSWHVDLLEDSPAVDSGSAAVSDTVSSDFRSIRRPARNGYDIGAVELPAAD